MSAPTNNQKAGKASKRQRHTYSTDRPIKGRAQDRFNRWPFAKRISETIANGMDPSSLVIGLYGPWGDGKTSTLAMMEEALTQRTDVVVFRFNPWLFGREEQLLRGFFSSMADALGRSLKTQKEKIGGLLEKYGTILSVASVDIAHVASVDAGKGAAALGKALSSVKLEELRVRLEAILNTSQKRLVALIDDIDRLDRAEIHAIFKLIKLSASFEHSTYVLAFDDDMVAAALGDKYGGGGVAAGRAFLEKIIQVPLHLPPADTSELRQVVLEGVSAVLEQAQITLTREQVEEFLVAFDSAIREHIKTPRQAKRIVNGIAFALPVLKGEANPVDVMLVEATRVAFPKLYIAIRDNTDLFLKGTGDDGKGEDARQTQLTALIEPTLGELVASDKLTIRKRLIEGLFPRTGRVGYSDDTLIRWAREQRICSKEYFPRFFSYGIPPGDVGDLEVVKFVDQLRAGRLGPDKIKSRLSEFSRRRAISRLLEKLRSQEEIIDAAAASRLALALAPHGALLPKEQGPMMFRTTFMQGAILIRHLLKRVPQREPLALQVLDSAEPLPFAFECWRWMRAFKGKNDEEDRVFPAESEATVARALVARIRRAAKQTALYSAFETDSPLLLSVWKEYGPPGEMETALRNWLLANSHEVDKFLEAFVGRSWGLESGVSRRSDFGRDSYNGVSGLVDPALILERLRAEYGEEITKSPERGEPSSLREWRLETARAFNAIHEHVMRERETASEDGEDSSESTETGNSA